MLDGKLPLGAFYEDLDFVHLSPYRHGIPSGLEGMRRRLIEEDGLKYEGIFRLHGRETALQSAEQRLRDGATISQLEATPIEIAQLIKAFYRKIPCDEPGYLPQALCAAETESDIVDQFAALSEPRKSLLLWTFDLWIGIEDSKAFNKMTLQSMSIVFSPNMVRCSSPNPMVFLELQKQVQRLTLEAATLRREGRLTRNETDRDEESLEPFKRDRDVRAESPEMQYPALGESSSSLGSFFKNCVVL